MKIHSLKIYGYKRLKNVSIQFGDATFLIGQNNCGKSSIIKAIEILLSAKKQLSTSDYHSIGIANKKKRQRSMFQMNFFCGRQTEMFNTFNSYKGEYGNYIHFQIKY